MPSKTLKFFKKDGKHLNHNFDKKSTKEAVSSLFDTDFVAMGDFVTDTRHPDNSEPFYIAAESKVSTFLDTLLSGLDLITDRLSKFKVFPEFTRPRFAVLYGVYSFSAFVLVSLFFINYKTEYKPTINRGYSIYSSKPLVIEDLRYEIYSKDSRAMKINEIYRRFNCPMEGLGEVIVAEADKNNIPWWIVPAISFQESSCGKNTPKLESGDTYNAWGWAVYGENVHSFDNWVRGIETVSKYLSNKFFSKGVTEPCDIMRVYTPSSNGSWCEGVNYFGDVIQGYKTPDSMDF